MEYESLRSLVEAPMGEFVLLTAISLVFSLAFYAVVYLLASSIVGKRNGSIVGIVAYTLPIIYFSPLVEAAVPWPRDKLIVDHAFSLLGLLLILLHYRRASKEDDAEAGKTAGS